MMSGLTAKKTHDCTATASSHTLSVRRQCLCLCEAGPGGLLLLLLVVRLLLLVVVVVRLLLLLLLQYHHQPTCRRCGAQWAMFPWRRLLALGATLAAAIQ